MKKTTTQGITAREYRMGKNYIRGNTITGSSPGAISLTGNRAAPQTARFEVFRAWLPVVKNGAHVGMADQFRFRFKGGNGEIIAPSEGYTRKAKALEAIELLRYSFDAPIVDLTLKKAKARKGKA